THPKLWTAALDAYRELSCSVETEPERKWSSLFTGTAVIVNRLSIPHTDRGGRVEWYDLLVSAANLEKAILELPQLGARIGYNSGTVV
ncbi:hypothetical protein B0H14DRAFT_2224636, partial [Mycena olivaceomarginata]